MAIPNELQSILTQNGGMITTAQANEVGISNERMRLFVNVEAEILLRNFMMERFLECIASSDYRHNFILKGGMLIAAMVGIDSRTTMDMDATIKGQTLNASEITVIIENILQIQIDDGAEFSLLGIEDDVPPIKINISKYVGSLLIV